MLLKLEARGQRSRPMVYLTPVLAIVLTLIAGTIMFAWLGYPPLQALEAYFIKPVSSAYGVSELLVKATPLALIGVGLAIGFRANVWNIGAEGQLTIGAIFAGGIALAFYEVDSPFILPLMIVAGLLGGLLWAAIPAYLRVRFNANEILTSLMLTYVAILILSYLVHGPWRDPDGLNFPESRIFSDSAVLPVILEGTRLHLGAVFALLAVVAGWVFISRTLVGFQVRVIGLSPMAADYAGFSQKKIIWLTLLLSGALAGLAGMIEVSGPIGQLLPTISPGYGFTAIIVAFLGRLHPLGIMIAALLMALTYLGGEVAQIDMNLPLAITGVFQGMILFFLLAVDVLINYRIRINWPGRHPAGEGQ